MISMKRALDLARDKRTIAIDGLPASGKSTLAEQLELRLGAVCLYLDDFVLPQDLWPRPLRPAYPFPYVRHADFVAAALALARERICHFQPYDWENDRLGPLRTLAAGNRPIVIEGVSALDAALSPACDLRLWVASDPASTLETALARGGDPWPEAWQNYFLPSVDHYLLTEPIRRADHIVAGRGATP
ncbi:hypothetical protein [uncultured Devosia sp.]|uniref:hypothetical protein n=1 Tax=uncultured Devosia sp. TaxID=211434 RepID=UPI0026129E78|nr:hypothetical protein [uncultured Devosia sp.]